MRKVVILLLGVAILAGASQPKGAFFIGSVGAAEEVSCRRDYSICVSDISPRPIFSLGFERRLSGKESWTLEIEARPFKIKKLEWENPQWGYNEDINEYFLTYSRKRYFRTKGLRFYGRGYLGLAFVNFYASYNYPWGLEREERFGIGPQAGIGLGMEMGGYHRVSFEILARFILSDFSTEAYATNFFGAKIGFCLTHCH